MPDILRHTKHVDQRIREHRETGLDRPLLLAVALGLACIALAVPAHLAVLAIVPALGSVVALLAAFRIMG